YLASRAGSGTSVALAAASALPQLRMAPAPAARGDFSPGAADLSAFPRGAWVRATAQVMATPTPADLYYSETTAPPPLRPPRSAPGDPELVPRSAHQPRPDQHLRRHHSWPGPARPGARRRRAHIGRHRGPRLATAAAALHRGWPGSRAGAGRPRRPAGAQPRP